MAVRTPHLCAMVPGFFPAAVQAWIIRAGSWGSIRCDIERERGVGTVLKYPLFLSTSPHRKVRQGENHLNTFDLLRSYGSLRIDFTDTLALFRSSLSSFPRRYWHSPCPTPGARGTGCSLPLDSPLHHPTARSSHFRSSHVAARHQLGSNRLSRSTVRCAALGA